MKEFILKSDDIDDDYLDINPYDIPNFGTNIRHNLNGNVYHNNYLSYLSSCYSSHYGTVVKPDYIWFTILCEIGLMVKDSPETYKNIFTDSNDKKEIVIPTGDPIQIDIDVLMNEVLKVVPSQIDKDNIILNFSTLTDSSKFAFTTSFLDTVSPYYNYSMYLCGFNKIKVLGTLEDYQMILDGINYFKNLFSGTPVSDYLDKCEIVCNNIVDRFNDQDFWIDIFTMERCGSGGQQEVIGWFKDLFNIIPRVSYVENFSTHISVINYKELVYNRNFTMSVGLLSSVISDDYLIPDFNFFINEINDSNK